jgi:hypothetical protein
MALLFCEGFDHYGTMTASDLGKWNSASSMTSFVASNPVPRTGQYCLRVSQTNSGVLSTLYYTTSGGVVMGMALYFENVAWGTHTPAYDVFDVRELPVGPGASYTHVAVSMAADRRLVAKVGATVVGTGTTVIQTGQWYYLEFKATISASGSFEVRLSGETEILLSGINTKNGGTGVWTHARIGKPISGPDMFIDDFYLCDTSGPAPQNTFLGMPKVETLFPQTDAVAGGSNAGLTPSTGTDHGALVDEIPPNTTDYNSSATVGVKDTYNYPPRALTTGAIFGVQTNPYAAKSDTSGRQYCSVIRTGGADYDGQILQAQATPTYQYFSEVWSQNPNTLTAWTTADIAAIQAGMKIVA